MATEYDTARSQYDNYRFCYDNGHEQWVKKARLCFDMWSGEQWDQKTINQLDLAGRPHLTLNVIESLVRSMKGIQRALRNDVRFTPVQNASTEDARVRDALWLHAQNENSFDFLETDTYEKGLIMGRAFYDVRVSYDESMQGQVQIRGRRSQDVVLDPSVDVYDPSEGWPQVYTRRWASYQDIENLYGKDKAESIGLRTHPDWLDYEDILMSQQMGRLPYYQSGCIGDPKLIRAYLLLDRQYIVVKNKDVFVDLETGDTSEIPETWDRNRISKVLEATPGVGTMKRKVKTVRWAVTCEQTVLHDEDSPYKDFTIVPYFPTFVDGHTMGAVESLVDPQMLYNKITSSELHIISTTANSGWKVKKGALKNMTISELEDVGARSGFVAELDDVKDLEKIQPNQTPQGHDRLSFKADQIMRSLSGVSNQARGFAREDVAGEAILANQAAQDINFAGWLSNLHRTKQLVAKRVVECMRTHYTETRVIQINRGSPFAPAIESITINEPTAEGGMVNDITQGKFSTVLVPAPSRATMSEEDFSLLLKLRTEIGVAIPDAMLIELSPASNKAQIIQMLEGTPDSNARQQAAEAAEEQQRLVDQQKAVATARKEEAAAMLNQARAEKFAVEAMTDPDAAYERVEGQRLAVTKQIADDRIALERDRLAADKEHDRRETALRLTELDNDREIEEVRAKATKDRTSLRRDKKPR